jgi:hypothetical protein
MHTCEEQAAGLEEIGENLEKKNKGSEEEE